MLFALLSLAMLQADSTPYANPATRELIERAMVRHASGDTAVRDYLSRFRYRLSFGLGRRRWAEVPNAAVEEQEGTVQWATPNDLRVEILGRRSKARSNDLNINSGFDRPWFVPRALGDSVRVFGNEIPSRAAIHPLAPNGPEWYRYRITDSLQLTSAGRRVKLIGVEVTPARAGISLVAGRMWLDAAGSDLVRFTFRFVGTEPWVTPEEDMEGDSAKARRANRIVNRILTLDADLEYSLQEGRYWMPYQQVVSGRVELPWFGQIVIPFEARTTFDQYAINTGRAISFTIPIPPEVTDPDSVKALLRARRDSIREERRERRRAEGRSLPQDSLPRDDAGRWSGGRYEIHRAPGDSLAAYAEWGDSLELNDDPAADREVRLVQSDLERMAAELPSDLTGKRRSGFTWYRIGEAIRYNRVQGIQPRLGYELTLPGDGFTTLGGEARFGLSDNRVVGRLTLVREAPGARWSVAAYREVGSTDPFARSNSFGGSLNALFAGHDDADYHLSHGVRFTREASLGVGLELTGSLLLERQSGVRREARSWINDALGGTGDFPANPPITDGTYAGAALRLDGGSFRTRWSLAADLLSDDENSVGRIYGQVAVPLTRSSAAPAVALKTGIASSPTLPQQAFRLGGGTTVRGFDYGTRRGQAFWAAQLDVPLRRGVVQPVLFADAGQAGKSTDLFSTRVIAGGGAGLSIAGGLVRFDLSHPISSGGSGLRFDLSMRALVWP